MAGHIVFAGMNINNIIDEINVDKPTSYHTSSYVGSVGSKTEYVSGDGRVITFKNICKYNEESPNGRGYRINDYISLFERYYDKVKVLTSPSKSNINGNYMLTGFNYTEDTQGNYIINWEFQEVIKFNVTEKTFRVWGKSVSSANKKKKTTTKTSNTENKLSSNIKLLLKSCPLMSKGSSSKKCVKSLQKFMQSKGYYKKYKVDGIFAIYTEQELKKLQKANKIKATGKWDKNTRAYWQKKYKYPTTEKKK